LILSSVYSFYLPLVKEYFLDQPRKRIEWQPKKQKLFCPFVKKNVSTSGYHQTVNKKIDDENE